MRICALKLAPIVVIALAATVSPVFCQQLSNQSAGSQNNPNPGHILGIIPNYKSSPSLRNYRPLTAGQKFKLATRDSFDPGNFALSAFLAGESQWRDSNPSFGQGAKGYAHYFATSFADMAIGDYMTEAVFPTMLRQDPRYFRRSTGSGWSRLGYAVGQIFFTHGDRGQKQFNVSEIMGNSAAVAISTAYHPENRNAGDAGITLATALGIDMAGNILREFWPEIARKISRNRNSVKP